MHLQSCRHDRKQTEHCDHQDQENHLGKHKEIKHNTCALITESQDTLHITHMTLTTCLHTNHTWTALLSFAHTQNVFHTVPHFAMMSTLRHKSRPDHSSFPSHVRIASTDLDIHTPVHSCLQNTAYFEGGKHEPAISTYLLFLFPVISFTLSRCCHHFQPLLHPPT